jgi:hypothetical protein
MNPRLVLIGAGLGLVVVAAVAYAARRGAPVIGSAINPLNRDNVFISGVNSVVKELTGEPTLGGLIATILNPDVRAADAAMAAPVVLPLWEIPAEVGAGYDLAYSNLIPVFQSTPGGAAVGLIR